MPWRRVITIPPLHPQGFPIWPRQSNLGKPFLGHRALSVFWKLLLPSPPAWVSQLPTSGAHFFVNRLCVYIWVYCAFTAGAGFLVVKSRVTPQLRSLGLVAMASLAEEPRFPGRAGLPSGGTKAQLPHGPWIFLAED